jgi:hypothetical protein
MSERQPNETRQQENVPEQMNRRGVFASAAALAGAAVAWLMGGGRAEATHLATGTPASDQLALHVDSVNAGTQRTFLVATVAGNPPLVSFNGSGPFSIGSADAIQGITRSGVAAAGVHGRNQAASGSGFGVVGETSSFSCTGVAGSCGLAVVSNFPGGVGVYGQSSAASGIGVRGQIPSNSSQPSTIAMYGENFGSDDGGAPGAGGFGCYGFSLKGHGLVGATATAGGGAVIGSTNGVPGAYAGIFYGQFTVVGGPKNAAVAHPDGRHRLLYCMESPESWFEDFGKAALVRGRADVAIDPEFAAVADVSEYHIFLTPYGNTNGLHVSKRTASSFTVEENDCGSSEIAFAWRLVARRKDISGERLAKVVLPAEPKHPTPPAAATDPEPPMVPAPRRRKHTH